MANKFIATIFITDHNFGQAVPLFVIHTQIDNMRHLFRADMDTEKWIKLFRASVKDFVIDVLELLGSKKANIVVGQGIQHILRGVVSSSRGPCGLACWPA